MPRPLRILSHSLPNASFSFCYHSYSVGPFSAEASFKYSSYDKSFAVNGVDPAFYLMLKLSYAFSFIMRPLHPGGADQGLASR